jgi:hypothetical protein
MSRPDARTTSANRTTNLLSIVVAAALAVAALSASSASAQRLVIADGMLMTAPNPSPYVRQESHHHGSPRVALIASGTGLLLGGWVGNMIVGSLGGWHAGHSCAFSISDSCTSTSSSFDPAWSDFRIASVIPVVGPIAQGFALPDASNGWPVFLAIDGVLQVGGLALLIAGLATSGDENDEGPPVTVAPVVTSTSVGMVVGGRLP